MIHWFGPKNITIRRAILKAQYSVVTHSIVFVRLYVEMSSSQTARELLKLKPLKTAVVHELQHTILLSE
jgi:predicted Zn-dependent protease